MELLDGMYAKHFPKWLCHFAFSPTMYDNSSYSTFSPTLDIVSLLNFGHSKVSKVASQCGFKLHSFND